MCPIDIERFELYSSYIVYHESPAPSRLQQAPGDRVCTWADLRVLALWARMGSTGAHLGGCVPRNGQAAEEWQR
jgi:hypothetical protein